ncbi:MAG: hypothetical protein AB7P18_06465 [Candidatus Binatia bacterium]
MIDIGTGVHFTEKNDHNDAQDTGSGLRRMGADVRLILPGNGCLLCVGNLTRYQQAVEELCRGGALPPQSEEWWQQRAGSLRTLNQIAAHTGVQMLQDLVAERIADSRWARLEFDDAGRMTVVYLLTSQSDTASPCRLCAKAGSGNAELGWTQ